MSELSPHIPDLDLITFYSEKGASLFSRISPLKKIDNKKITLAAMLTAASFAIFQVSIPLFGGVHINLTSLIGILAGPAIGGIIVLIVNILLALILVATALIYVKYNV